MTTFILNEHETVIDLKKGRATLKTIRKNLGLSGTKGGCGEGDCGACMVLLGELKGDAAEYKAINSCLLPVGELGGKHIATIEGLNHANGLGFIQQCFVDEFASQCGFCTPGFIIALTGYLLNARVLDENEAFSAISGNICRCTGYASIRRAVGVMLKKLDSTEFERSAKSGTKISFLIKNKVLPEYWSGIAKELKNIIREKCDGKIIVGGGTDLCVQKRDEMEVCEPTFLSARADLKEIITKNGQCIIGGAVTFEDVRISPIIAGFFPEARTVFEMVASLPVRNRATVAGNIANASPIGDMTVFLLALDAVLVLSNGKDIREVRLCDFFNGYKKTDLRDGEVIELIKFPIPAGESKISFEKVSKRKHLDIASVNTAALITAKSGVIGNVRISMGGVGPIPFILSKTNAFLTGKKINEGILSEAGVVADTEISPISDVRGSDEYKRLLAKQLLLAHFIKLFPENF